MALRLPDLIDVHLLDELLAAGYVKAVDHPTCDLTILNYTHQAQYDRVWNDVTRACRGLIYNRGSLEVVARPWPKFFNYGEHQQSESLSLLDLTSRVEVTDKLDGSLGIAYPLPTYPGEAVGSAGCMVATRGSFTSDQALTGTGFLAMEKFAPDWDLTYLFEIIYPENRIVVDYEGFAGLCLLGAVVTATGATLSPFQVPGWRGSRVEVFESETLADALALEPRPNREGVVVRYPETGVLVKIKQDDYVALHRIVTGMNERTVWELLGNGKTVDDICAPLPEEFWVWVRRTANDLLGNAHFILESSKLAHELVVSKLPAGWTRKDYALEAKKAAGSLLPYCFMLLDGKDPYEAIWRTVRPTAPVPLVRVSEDVA